MEAAQAEPSAARTARIARAAGRTLLVASVARQRAVAPLMIIALGGSVCKFLSTLFDSAGPLGRRRSLRRLPAAPRRPISLQPQPGPAQSEDHPDHLL